MSIKKLHPTQEKLLELLKTHADDPLTIRELQEAVDASSTSVVAHHLLALEKKGFLKRNPYNPKDYQVLSDNPEKQITFLNLYGLAHCGPKGSLLDGSPIDRVPLSTRLLSFPSVEGFMVKAKGDSMEPKIHDGDLLIARRSQDADNGSVVVCINDGEALVKKVQRNGNQTFLTSLNSSYSPFLASTDFRIEGIIKGVISQNIQSL